MKISVVYTIEDKTKENQFCLINFRRDEDLKAFSKKFQEVIDEVSKK